MTSVLFDSRLFFETVTNTDIAFYVFYRKASLTMSHTFASFCVLTFISYLYLLPLGDKLTPQYLPCKGKAVPLQAWSGPEGSRKLRFPDFMTTAQYGGKVVSLTHRPPLSPANTPGTHFC